MNTKHISLRIIWNDIRFVHKMYGRGKGFDIPCVIIYGESMGWPHCWNLVQMEDGKWYGADLTNDDGGELSPHYYNYFL